MKFCCLDVGNVLVHVDFVPFMEALSRQLNITMEDAQYFMNRTCKLHDLGLTCMEDELKDHFKIKSQVILREMLEKWNQAIWVNESMLVKLIEWSTQKNVRIALLSNVGLEHVKIMERTFGKIPNLVTHFSCYVGARKPNMVYYQSFLQLHPEWQGSVYIDDLQENLDASVQFGFRPFRFSLEQDTTTWSLPRHGGDRYQKVKLGKMLEIERLIFGEQTSYSGDILLPEP